MRNNDAPQVFLCESRFTKARAENLQINLGFYGSFVVERKEDAGRY